MKNELQTIPIFRQKSKKTFGEIYIDNFAKSNEKVNIGRKRLIC